MIPNELRIGNWVNYRTSDNPIQIKARDILDAESRPLIGWQMIYRPILLDSEILIKCEFEKIVDVYRKVNNDLSYNFQISFTGKGFTPSFANINYAILYLHQLQNLFFSLCGEELNYKI